MAITLVGGSIIFPTGSGKTTISKPSGVQSGDLLLFTMFSDSATSAPSCSGFTTLVSRQDGSGGTIQYVALAYKVAGSAEPSTYTFTPGTGHTWDGGAMVALRGQDGTTPIDASNGAGGTGVSSVTNAALTASVSGDELVLFQISDNNTNVSSWPSGVTTYSPASNVSAGMVTGTKALTSSGSTGSLTTTMAASDTLSVLAVLVKAPSSGGTVSGSATEQANAVIAESAQLLAPATVQGNAAIAEAAQLVTSATVQGNAAVTEAAHLLAPATVQANAGISVSATILQAPIAVQANSATAETAQIAAPATLQSNAVLSATGSLVGGIVSGTATMQANAALAEASAHILAPAALQSNAALSAAGGVVGKVAGSANVAANAGIIVHAVVLASVAPVQANAAISEAAQVTQPSITAQASAALVQTAAAVLASTPMPADAALTLAQALILATAAMQANAVLDATGHIPLPAGYKSPVGTTVRRGGLTATTVRRPVASATTVRQAALTGSTVRE